MERGFYGLFNRAGSMKICRFCKSPADVEFTYAGVQLCARTAHFDLVKLTTCSIGETVNLHTGRAMKVKVARGTVNYQKAAVA